MIKIKSEQELEKMSKEELEQEFENIYEEVSQRQKEEKEFGGANKQEIMLPDATGKQNVQSGPVIVEPLLIKEHTNF